MNVLFCRVGWMDKYRGMRNDDLVGGGSFNQYYVGSEIYNFYLHDEMYYGFVQPVSNSIQIDRLSGKGQSGLYSVDGITVVWIATNPESGGQYIIGWYKDARVFRQIQEIPPEDMGDRDPDYNIFNIMSKQATLVPPHQRTYKISYKSTSNVWYGNREIKNDVLRYIDSFVADNDDFIDEVENTDTLTGFDKAVISKARINQGYFRDILLKKYKKCCLCGVTNRDFLIASHIKPWSESDKNEKVDINNGLLLCPAHDRLFDKGYITFDESGDIVISSELSAENRMFLNVAEGMSIKVTKENAGFIRYHRENIFKV